MKLNTLDVLWSRIEKTESCWNWKGGISVYGYGQFMMNKKNYRVHKLIYELLKGKVPDGLELDHLCRVRHCVNPEHLEAVTHDENVKRGNDGLFQKLKTHCPQGHSYSGDNLYLDKKGYRRCRQCHNFAEINRRRRMNE